MDDDIDDLAARARAGDAAAMDALLALLRPIVLSRCSRLLPHHHDAEDAAQDALLSIATKLTDFTGAGSFRGWVTVIASNAARQTYRSMRRHFVETTDQRAPEVADPRTTSVIAGSRIGLLDAIDDLERTHPATVEAFILRDLGALPYAEIADQLGVPVGTVKARVHAARASVREHWSAGAPNF